MNDAVINNFNDKKRSWTSMPRPMMAPGPKRRMWNLETFRTDNPNPPTINPGCQRNPNSMDKHWSGRTSHNREQRQSSFPRPFREIGSDEFRITQELRHYDRGQKRRDFRRYKRTRDREETPPIDGHTPFSSRILKIHPPRHFIRPIGMKYDGSTDSHVHFRDFEHHMVCDGAV
ncbi:hypothetical protein PIB30_019742 [Stylosanthes scabra]|uniref:Uncharacterized protein n=1 Tax=Stylosanthes scabra TaxID=79078 RepID=A0ABU6WBY6_9FABA|nr:hypothetical protein [Stylosanthes scabra]